MTRKGPIIKCISKCYCRYEPEKGLTSERLMLALGAFRRGIGACIADLAARSARASVHIPTAETNNFVDA